MRIIMYLRLPRNDAWYRVGVAAWQLILRGLYGASCAVRSSVRLDFWRQRRCGRDVFQRGRASQSSQLRPLTADQGSGATVEDDETMS